MREAPERRVLITGGAGYLGSMLTPKVLAHGARVTVLDSLLFGEGPLEGFALNPAFTLVRGDIRDEALVRRVLADGRFDSVIHLAAISNDPSSELDPVLTRSVNREALEAVMRYSHELGARRFLYASSASVYGIKDVPDVTESLPLEPITLYARYKAEGEQVLERLLGPGFVGVSVRAATVCGWSPRLRLDLTINILTSHAVTRGALRVFGGSQLRPNVHIEDLTDFYVLLLDADPALVNGRALNVSTANASVMGLAEMVRDVIDPALPIEVVPTDDARSYHLSSQLVRDLLGYVPSRPLRQAVVDLAEAFRDGRVPEPDSPWYRNVELMKRAAAPVTSR